MAKVEKLSVALTADLAATVRAAVAEGGYASTSEVVREALRDWQRQRAADAERLAVIRARVRRSLDDPSPSLTEDELDAGLARLLADAAPERGGAPA